MKLKLLLTSVLTTLCIICNAQSRSYSLASDLGENLRLWEVTGNDSYRWNIDNMCKGEFNAKVANELASRLQTRNPSFPKEESYDMESYLEWLDDAFQSGLKLTTTNYKQIPASKMRFEKDKQSKYSSKMNLEYFSCDVEASGLEKFKSKDLIIISNGRQIAKIDDYREDASGHVHTDLSDIMDDWQTFGATYNYSKDWPVGVSLNYSFEQTPIMLSLDFGINFKKDKVYKHDLTMTDVMNFTKNDYEYDSKWYVTLTPQFYLKYFSIGCGAGVMCISEDAHGLQTISTSYSAPSTNTSYTSSSSSTVVTSGTPEDKYKFMIRPTVKGFIPIVKDEWLITVSAAYNYCFAYKEVNGIDFGIGVQYNFGW